MVVNDKPPANTTSNQRCSGYPMTTEEAIRRIRLKLDVRKQNPWSEGQVCWVEIGEVETLIAALSGNFPSSDETNRNETQALARFGLMCLEESRELLGDLDGAWLQDKATECGLLEPVEVTEQNVCSGDEADYCECAIGDTCYRRTAASRALGSSEKASALHAPSCRWPQDEEAPCTCGALNGKVKHG